MKLINILKIASIILIAALFSACQKVVVLDLNTAEPILVIEGNVTSKAGPQTVFVSTTGSFYNAEGIEPVDNAVVTINDESGNSYLLEMFAPGIYYTYDLQPQDSVEYAIEVSHEGEVYTGSEVFPQKKRIDSLSYILNEGIFGDGLNEDGDTTYNLLVRFQDPAETLDYYRFIVIINDTIARSGFSSYIVSDDELFNGQLFDFEIRGLDLIKGDKVDLEFQAIGFNTYQYYRTLNDALRGGVGSTPYNPISNISNNALGYFGAYTSDSQTIFIE